MAKKCPPGKYYCFDDKKCKKIPRGYHIGARGFLARDTKEKMETEMVTETLTEMGTVGMVLEMVTVALVVMVVVMAQAGSGNQ